MSLAENIKKLRKENNITQEYFAEKIGVSRQTVSNWENNKSFPNMDLIVQISETFNIPTESLIQTEFRETMTVYKENEMDRIQKNKCRVILSRLYYFRIVFVWAGALWTSYLWFSKTYLNYLWLSILILFFGFIFTLPINWIRKKYNLKTKEDISIFLNELYK